MQNTEFGSKNKIAYEKKRNVSRNTGSCSMQKTAGKTSLYSKNESIFKLAKNGHNGKALAHAESLVWVKK